MGTVYCFTLLIPILQQRLSDFGVEEGLVVSDASLECGVVDTGGTPLLSGTKAIPHHCLISNTIPGEFSLDPAVGVDGVDPLGVVGASWFALEPKEHIGRFGEEVGVAVGFDHFAGIAILPYEHLGDRVIGLFESEVEGVACGVAPYDRDRLITAVVCIAQEYDDRKGE